MRIALPKLLAPVIAAMIVLPATPALAEEPIVVNGGGWGHGIGMPQWGAKAMADSGSNHEQILQHFYTGAQFGEVGEQFVSHAEPLHIGLDQELTIIAFRAVNGPLTLSLNGSFFTANPGENWRFQADGSGNCRFVKDGAAVEPGGPCSAEITWSDQPDVRVEFPNLQRTYARGKVIFKPLPATFDPPKPEGYTFHVIIEVPLEEYLLGLGEVPNPWHMEALYAQAIAARTYALYKAWAWRFTLNPGCGCHLYASTLDQSYRGWDTNPVADFTEAGPNGQRWSKAVADTRDKAMWHSRHGSERGLEAYYFSSTASATENNEDVWGGSPYEYLRSRSDPGPTFWAKEFGRSNFAALLGFDSVTWVGITATYDSGSPKSVLVRGEKNGSAAEATFTGKQMKSLLGLRSHYVRSITGLVPPFPAGADIPVLHDPTSGLWKYWANGGKITNIYFGDPGDHAFMGDWNCDGVGTPGLYRRSDGFVYLRNSNTQGVADITFFFGNPGDVPIAGDFNGDGCDTLSIYRPSEQVFYIINRLGQNGGGLGKAEYSYMFGNPGDIPFAGDWNGDGVDTPGLRRPSNGFVYLKNSNTTGLADIEYFYGNPGDLVFAGDWDNDGDDTLGLYRPSNGFVYLKNSNSTGKADIEYQMGTSVHKPVAG